MKIGDLVSIRDRTQPRNVYPRGIVTAVFPGKDGRVRQAEVRTATGLMLRPVDRMAVLRIESPHPEVSDGGESVEDTTIDGLQPPSPTSLTP